MQWISENQSAPKLENRKTSPCSPCAPNLLHVLVSRILGHHNLCSPAAICIWKNLNQLKIARFCFSHIPAMNLKGRTGVYYGQVFYLIFLLKTLNYAKISVNIEVKENISKKPHKFPSLQNSFTRIDWISGQNEP